MNDNASPTKPIQDDTDLMLDTKAVLDRLIESVDVLVTKNEDDASSLEDSGRCSGSQFGPYGSGQVVTDQEVEDHSACGYSLDEELESTPSVESLDEVSDFLSSPIPMSEGSSDSLTIDDDLYPSSSEEPQFSDDFLPRDTSPETVGYWDDEGQGGSDEGQGVSDEGIVGDEGPILAEIEFLERMMLFFMDGALFDNPDLEQMGGGDHVQEHELD